MSKAFYMESDRLDVYYNLAVEEYLLDLCSTNGTTAFYLWQNEASIIIGRNQCIEEECNIEYANTHHVKIARRITGGGAVYHDEGNLNFSIITPKEEYNISKSTNMILDALSLLGVKAVKSEKNDILLDGKKISGNAYYSNDDIGLHHGTLLLKVDDRLMDNLLTPTKQKLDRHGIKSVHQRVTDLCSYNSEITMSMLKEALKDSFKRMYGVQEWEYIMVKEDDIRNCFMKYTSTEWIYAI